MTMDSSCDREYNVRISYLEIYNEQVKDLLVEKSPALMLVEDPVRGVFVPDLKEVTVTMAEEVKMR